MINPWVWIGICWAVLMLCIVFIMSRLASKRNIQLEMYSNCCGAKSTGELWEEPDGSFSGRCARCKDNAIFLQIEDER